MDRRIRCGALGGLDTLVFAAASARNAPVVRARVCDGLGFLGIELDEKPNVANAGMISTNAGRVAVRVIHTDEEWMIAEYGPPRFSGLTSRRRVKP